MAETVKKTKAPAKSGKTATKNAPAAEVAKTVTPSREEIARLARKFWTERGWQDGYAEIDWLRAEQELREAAS